MTDNHHTPDQLLAEDSEKSQALAATIGAIASEQLEMNQLLGRIQATHAIGNMLEALSLSQLHAIKERKAYRSLQGQTQEINGTPYDLGTWDGFCKAIGSSRQQVDEQLQNLQLLGEQALENAQALGMTTRELRKLRQLPDDDRQVIIGDIEANVGDKDGLIEAIEAVVARNHRQKAELQEKLDEQTAEREADSKVIEAKNSKIDELERQIIKQETAEPMQKALTFAQLISEIEVAIGAEIGKLETAFANIEQANNTEQLPERLRINQGATLVAIKQWCDNLIDRYGLSDISETGDGLDWVAEAKKAVESGDVPDYVKSSTAG